MTPALAKLRVIRLSGLFDTRQTDKRTTLLLRYLRGRAAQEKPRASALAVVVLGVHSDDGNTPSVFRPPEPVGWPSVDLRTTTGCFRPQLIRLRPLQQPRFWYRSLRCRSAPPVCYAWLRVTCDCYSLVPLTRGVASPVSVWHTPGLTHASQHISCCGSRTRTFCISSERLLPPYRSLAPVIARPSIADVAVARIPNSLAGHAPPPARTTDELVATATATTAIRTRRLARTGKATRTSLFRLPSPSAWRSSRFLSGPKYQRGAG